MKKRRIGWDFLRILMALMVFSFHANIHINLKYGAITEFISVGAICMTGFFILSGAVLSYTNYEKEFSSIDNRLVFYKKRLLAIMPLYWFVMINFYLEQGFPDGLDRALMIPIEILGIQSPFLGSFYFGHNGGTWFVSCLLFCYVAFPLVNDIIKRMSMKRLLCLLITFSIIDIYSELIVAYFSFGEFYSTPFMRMVQFFLGCLICSILLRLKTRVRREICWGISITLIFLLSLVLTILVKKKTFFEVAYLQRMATYNFIVLPCFVILVGLFYFLDFKSNIIAKTICFINKFCYAFFLAQFFVWDKSEAIYELFDINDNKIRFIIALLVCVIITAILYFDVEVILNVFLEGWSKKLNLKHNQK